VPSHTQAVVAEFIDEGHFSAHVRRMRHVYLERHETLVAAANRRLAGLLDLVPAHSGLHTIGHLTAEISELAVARDADQRQVTASPIGRFALSPVDVNGLVLGFGGVSPKLIDAGVEVLAQVLENQRAPSAGRKSRSRAAVV
jgi:GntR family transcriptional regulator/MocR family aminotransferase